VSLGRSRQGPATKLAKGITTAIAESVDRSPGEGLDAGGLKEVDSQCRLPCGTNLRLVDVEIPAHLLETAAARACEGLEQVADRQG
jgi:hypothetical protein